MAGLLLGAAACQKEVGGGDEPAAYASISSSLGRDTEGVDGAETKSLISVDVENFHKAMLFAFNPSTKKILTYGSNAPANLQGQPVMISTTTKDFEWALPLKTAMTIYTIVNYGSLDMSAYTSKGANLTMTDLEGITFSCASSTQLQQLETTGAGLPMSGTTNVSASDFTTGTETLSVKVKKLFARYNLYLDLSDLAASSASVVAEHAIIYNMNNTVHYFGAGDKSSVSHISTGYDRATENQLEVLQAGGNSNQVTFYVLENMQGNISGATSWSTVYQDLGSDKLKYCTFLSLSVLVTDASGRADTRTYRIYLGKTDMKSNFDVQRNYDKTIRLKVNNDPGTANDSFVFTNSTYTADNSVLTLAPSQSATLYFETTLDIEQVNFSFTNADNGQPVEFLSPGIKNKTGSVTRNGRTYNRGTVQVTANSSATIGTNVEVSGGSSMASSKQLVRIMRPFTPGSNELWIEWRLSEVDGQVARYTFISEDTSFNGTVCFKIDGQLSVPSNDSWNRTYSEPEWSVTFTNGVGVFHSIYPANLTNTTHTFNGVVSVVSGASGNSLQGYQNVMIWPKSRRSVPYDSNTDKYPIRFTGSNYKLTGTHGGDQVSIPFKTGRSSAQVAKDYFALSNNQDVEIVQVNYNANTSNSNLFPHSGTVLLRAKTTRFSENSVNLYSRLWSITEYEDSEQITLESNNALKISSYWMPQMSGSTMKVTFYFTANDNSFSGNLSAKSTIVIKNVSNNSTIYSETNKNITLNFTNGRAEYSVSFSVSGNPNFNVSSTFTATSTPSGYDSVTFN